MNGREYVPGGTAEIDELWDLYAIWNERDERRQQKGTGASANMMDDD